MEVVYPVVVMPNNVGVYGLLPDLTLSATAITEEELLVQLLSLAKLAVSGAQSAGKPVPTHTAVDSVEARWKPFSHAYVRSVTVQV